MDASMMTLLAIMAALVAACIAMYVGFLKAMRRAGSESRRRLIARAAVINWAALAVLTPAILLAALDVLPHWVPGIGLVVAGVVSLLSARYARRSTLRSQGFA